MAFYNQDKDFTNFVISFSQNPKYDFSAFAQGYKSAADTLAKELIEKANFADYQVYPVVFLYRHSFELSLKNIIYWSKRLLVFKGDKDIENNLENTHDLVRLAANAETILTAIFSDNKHLHKVIQNIVYTAKDFSAIDFNSHSYRYPINNKGDDPTKKNQLMNLSSFSRHMDNLLEDLDMINSGLDGETYKAQEFYEAILYGIPYLAICETYS